MNRIDTLIYMYVPMSGELSRCIEEIDGQDSSREEKTGKKGGMGSL